MNNFFLEIWILLLEMSPYLLFGFLISGILKVYLPKDFLTKHLFGSNFASVLKAALIGVPLPICSCGVIPIAAHLQKSKASKGSILSFLTSAPTTGVDSIIATYSLLGGVFTFFRTIASFFIGILAGFLVNILDKKNTNKKAETLLEELKTDEDNNENYSSLSSFLKIKKIFEYGFITLVEDIAKWLVIGIVLGAAISYFMPQHFIDLYYQINYILIV